MAARPYVSLSSAMDLLSHCLQKRRLTDLGKPQLESVACSSIQHAPSQKTVCQRDAYQEHWHALFRFVRWAFGLKGAHDLGEFHDNEA